MEAGPSDAHADTSAAAASNGSAAAHADSNAGLGAAPIDDLRQKQQQLNSLALAFLADAGNMQRAFAAAQAAAQRGDDSGLKAVYAASQIARQLEVRPRMLGCCEGREQASGQVCPAMAALRRPCTRTFQSRVTSWAKLSRSGTTMSRNIAMMADHVQISHSKAQGRAVTLHVSTASNVKLTVSVCRNVGASAAEAAGRSGRIGRSNGAHPGRSGAHGPTAPANVRCTTRRPQPPSRRHGRSDCTGAHHCGLAGHVRVRVRV